MTSMVRYKEEGEGPSLYHHRPPELETSYPVFMEKPQAMIDLM
jgi:hypothetical protein